MSLQIAKMTDEDLSNLKQSFKESAEKLCLDHLDLQVRDFHKKNYVNNNMRYWKQIDSTADLDNSKDKQIVLKKDGTYQLEIYEADDKIISDFTKEELNAFAENILEFIKKTS